MMLYDYYVSLWYLFILCILICDSTSEKKQTLVVSEYKSQHVRFMKCMAWALLNLCKYNNYYIGANLCPSSVQYERIVCWVYGLYYNSFFHYGRVFQPVSHNYQATIAWD